MSISRIFEKHENKDMARQFVIVEVLSDLKTIVTRAIFIFSGNVLLLRDKSKMRFNGTNKELNFALQYGI